VDSVEKDKGGTLSGRGGAGRGQGRKKGSTGSTPPRNVVKQVRWTADEWAEVEKLAAAAGVSPSEFIRNSTLGGS
jgi:hypothetical protein